MLRFGRTDTKPYTMLNIDIGQMQELQFIDEEKDLGVTIDLKLKFSSHIVNEVKKANRLMGLIWRSYNFLDIVSFRYLLISLVRPYLEYCVTVWYPLSTKRCFQDVTVVIKFNLWRKTCGYWNTEYEKLSNAWKYDHVF